LKTKLKIKTLLVGCGRIGAGRGLPEHLSNSHAGVLSGAPAFDVALYDVNRGVVQASAELLGLRVLEKIDSGSLSTFECVIICTPTETHFQLISQLLRVGTPLIVCEKPVCTSVSQVKALKKLITGSKSRILVNYTRRFQPAFKKLKKRFALQLHNEVLCTISVRYQRGFLNNASHALDLIQFLTGWDIMCAEVCSMNKVCDEFPSDPTVSCHGNWNGVALSILGLPNVQFSFFEIDFFFQRTAIRFRDRGSIFEFCDSAEPSDYYAPLFAKNQLKDDQREPLVNLYRQVRLMLRNPKLPDSFEDTLRLTEWMLLTLDQQ
jgi:hypothetical protein